VASVSSSLGEKSIPVISEIPENVRIFGNSQLIQKKSEKCK
jgi:hypothetical protein